MRRMLSVLSVLLLLFASVAFAAVPVERGAVDVALANAAPANAAPANAAPANIARIIVEDSPSMHSCGSGTLIRPDLVITNWHVVQDRTGKVYVQFPSGKVEATVVKTGRKWDLAALRIKPVEIPYVELGNRPKIGDTVTVSGYGSGNYKSATGKVAGFVTPGSVPGSIPDYFRVTTQVRNGDSGGPMISDGKLVGVLFGCQADGTYGTTVDRVKKFLKGVK